MPVELSSSSDDEALQRDMRQLHRAILPEERRTAQRLQNQGVFQQPNSTSRSNTVTFRQEVIEVRAGMWYHTRDASYKHLLKRPPPPSAQLYDPIRRTTVLASDVDVKRFYLYIADRQPETSAADLESHSTPVHDEGGKCRQDHSRIVSLMMQRKTRLDTRGVPLEGLLPSLVYQTAASTVVQYTQGEFVKLRHPMGRPNAPRTTCFVPDPFCIVKTDPVSRVTRLVIPQHSRGDYKCSSAEEGTHSSCSDELLRGTPRRNDSGVEVGMRVNSKQVYSLAVGKVGILQQGSVVVVDTMAGFEPTTATYPLLLPRRSLVVAPSFVGLCTVPESAAELDGLSDSGGGFAGTRVALVEERGIYEGTFGHHQLPLQLRVGFPRQRQVQCATYLLAAERQSEGPNLLIGFASGDLMLHDPRHSTRTATLSRPGVFAEWKGAFGGRKGAVQSLLPISAWSCIAAISDGSIHLIDTRRLANDGYHIETVELYAPPIPVFSTRRVDATGDGQLCAFGTCDGKVRVLNLRSLQTVADLHWPLARSDGDDAVGQPVFETVMIHRQLSQKSPDSPFERQLCVSLNAAAGSRTGGVETLYCGEW
jgi:hypothetical protein